MRALIGVAALAVLLAACAGPQADYHSAARGWQEAAQAGDADAQNNLGLAYSQGRGVEADPVKAVYWWRKAATQDYAPAQFNLAVAYRLGHGVPQDKVRALMWYELALPRSAQARRYRDELAAEMNAEDVRQARSLATQWRASRAGQQLQ